MRVRGEECEDVGMIIFKPRVKMGGEVGEDMAESDNTRRGCM